MEGILMVAVQTLARRSEEQARELQTLRAENASLRTQQQQIAQLASEVAELRARQGNLSTSPGMSAARASMPVVPRGQ
jgi:cell shape-determining protein MreC